jgi:pilus assembly protein Flp/PilA
MLEKMKNLVVEEEGQALSEYGLIIALIAVVAIAGVSAFGSKISEFFNGLWAQLSKTA